MDKALSGIVRDLSTDRAFEHIDFLVNHVGERIAGTPEMEEAAGYILDRLVSYGLEARIDRFPIYHS